MKRKWYRRFACTSVAFTEVCLLLVCLIAGQLKAQDTVLLNAVEIKVIKFDLSELGKKTEKLDSGFKAQFKLNTLNDVLSNQSTVFIKSYGPGAIATTALRGGNASQTAILWNGFNLQNNMLGQTDLSLLPSFLFENVDIEYGGSSSVWGSGAIAGSIQLNSASKFGAGQFSSINIGAGSYGKLSSSAVVQLSKKRVYSSSKAYVNQCSNDFKYKDTSDHEQPIKYAKNAAYASKGFMQDLEFLIKNNQALRINAWIHHNKRDLQATDPQQESKVSQEDNALRLMASWTYARNRLITAVKSAFFQDKLNYIDGEIGMSSKSTARSLMIENDNYFRWFKDQQFNFSLNVLTSDARSDNYDAKRGMNRISVLAGNKSYFFREKLTAYVSLRFEYYSLNTLPVTGNVSFDYKLAPGLVLKANASKVYRQPTLNELYWQPGGNEDLKPEQGYTFEGEINYSKKIKSVSCIVSLAAYSRNIKDWILWVPGANGNPSPSNIQDVWSRGTETTWKVNYEKGKFRTGYTFMTSYVLSTIQSSQQENDLSLGKQLIYTPRYTLNGNVFLGYKQVDIYYSHQYFGYRFTSTDNAVWLDPYHVASIRANYTLHSNKLNYLLFAACNNLFNQDYTVIKQRPMPLRNYEIGMTIQFKSKTK